jgi:hypothetical protein
MNESAADFLGEILLGARTTKGVLEGIRVRRRTVWPELEASDDGEAKLTGVTGERRELCRTADADVKGFAVILEARGVI